MDIRFLAGSAASVVTGLYMISASGAQTMVSMPTGPYQSQSRPVLIGMPEPAKSLLGIGGTLIAMGGGLGCLYKGLEVKNDLAREAELDAEEAIEESIIPYRDSKEKAMHRTPVAVGAGSEDEIQGEVYDQVRETPLAVSVGIKSPVRVSYTHKTSTQDKKTLLDEYEDPLLCSKMAKSNKSIIICSPPGTGKSTLVEGFVAELFKNRPDSELHIVDQKGKTWLGLGKIPGVVVMPTRDDFGSLVDKIATVSSILEERLEEAKQRKAQGLPEIHYHPVWLILDDYLSLYDNLSNVLESDVVNRVKSDLKYIITVGREYNVMALVITHSPNVDDIGLSDPVRKAAGIITLGRIDPDRDDGGFMAIWDMICKGNIVTSRPIRDRLQETMRLVEPYCTANKRSCFFSTMGQVRIGIVPDLSWVAGYQLDIAPPESDGHYRGEQELGQSIDPWAEPEESTITDWSNAI